MYVEINEVIFNKSANEVTIKATDLDSITLADWDTDLASINASREFWFDLENTGNRSYLYKIIMSKGDKTASSLSDKLKSLTGKMVFINGNFLAKNIL